MQKTKKKHTQYEIAKVLILSTSHIKRETAEAVGPPNRPDSYGVAIHSGYLFHAQEDPDDDDPVEVTAACKLASKLGCQWLKYDCDGPIYPELTEYEW